MKHCLFWPALFLFRAPIRDVWSQSNTLRRRPAEEHLHGMTSVMSTQRHSSQWLACVPRHYLRPRIRWKLTRSHRYSRCDSCLRDLRSISRERMSDQHGMLCLRTGVVSSPCGNYAAYPVDAIAKHCVWAQIQIMPALIFRLQALLHKCMCHHAQKKTAASLPDDAAEWEGARRCRRASCSTGTPVTGRKRNDRLERDNRRSCATRGGGAPCRTSRHHIRTSHQKRRRRPA